MIESVNLSIERKIKRQAKGKWSSSLDEDDKVVVDPVDLGAVEPETFEKIFTHDLIIPEMPVTSDKNDPDIKINYFLVVKVNQLFGVTYFAKLTFRLTSSQKEQRYP